MSGHLRLALVFCALVLALMVGASAAAAAKSWGWFGLAFGLTIFCAMHAGLQLGADEREAS